MSQLIIGEEEHFLGVTLLACKFGFGIIWMSCILEEIVFDNIFNTMMDIKGKTKDKVKA